MAGRQNKIIVILGRKGCGKTTLAMKLAKRIHFESKDRVVCVAPMGGFQLAGSPVIRSDDLNAYESLAGRSFLVLPDCNETAENAFEFCWTAQEKNPVKDLWLFVDEIDLYFSFRQPDPFLTRIVRYGRHARINLVAISQRPANIHNDLLAQADEKIIFNTNEPNDLVYLKKYAGCEPAELQQLPKFKYIRL